MLSSRKKSAEIKYAGMVKLADTLDLGSNAVRRAGSSPVTRTMDIMPANGSVKPNAGIIFCKIKIE